MRVVAVIQARMGSTRLPGKPLRLIHGKTMVQVHAERLAYCRTLDSVWLATSTSPKDDVLARHCYQIPGWILNGHTRGSEEKLDERLLKACDDAKADAIVRITADCPLVDPALVDALVMAWRRWVSYRPLDYASNVFPNRTYPDGLDVEILSRAYLIRSVIQESPAWDHEALTTNVWKRPEVFCWLALDDVVPSLGDLRWTVDRADDLYFVKWVYEHLPAGFGWKDVLALRDDWAVHMRHDKEQIEMRYGK